MHSTKATSEKPAQSASATGGAGVESFTQIVGTGPASEVDPPTLVVDALHRGNNSTLTAALSAAGPATVFLFGPVCIKKEW